MASFALFFTFLAAIPTGLIAIVLAVAGLYDATTDPAVGGRGLAAGGLVCGGLGVALAVAAFTFSVHALPAD